MAEAAAAGPTAGGGRILAAITGPSAESPGLSGPQGPGVSENTALVIPEDVPRPQIQSEGAVVIGRVFDVDMDVVSNLMDQIKDTHGFAFLDYDIMFKGICPGCQK